jgi:hypothetical protein
LKGLFMMRHPQARTVTVADRKADTAPVRVRLLLLLALARAVSPWDLS